MRVYIVELTDFAHPGDAPRVLGTVAAPSPELARYSAACVADWHTTRPGTFARFLAYRTAPAPTRHAAEAADRAARRGAGW